MIVQQPRFKVVPDLQLKCKSLFANSFPLRPKFLQIRFCCPDEGSLNGLSQDSQISCRLRYHFLCYNCNLPEETLSQKTVPCASIILPAAPATKDSFTHNKNTHHDLPLWNTHSLNINILRMLVCFSSPSFSDVQVVKYWLPWTEDNKWKLPASYGCLIETCQLGKAWFSRHNDPPGKEIPGRSGPLAGYSLMFR